MKSEAMTEAEIKDKILYDHKGLSSSLVLLLPKNTFISVKTKQIMALCQALDLAGLRYYSNETFNGNECVIIFKNEGDMVAFDNRDAQLNYKETLDKGKRLYAIALQNEVIKL